MGASGSKPPDRLENAEKTGVYARRAAGLTIVPEKVWALSNLRTLDLSENKLISEAIIKMKRPNITANFCHSCNWSFINFIAAVTHFSLR